MNDKIPIVVIATRRNLTTILTQFIGLERENVMYSTTELATNRRILTATAG
jgi:hypothetical protein